MRLRERSQVMQTDDIELEKIDTFVNLENKRILEVGCGEGRLSGFLARKAGQLIDGNLYKILSIIAYGRKP